MSEDDKRIVIRRPVSDFFVRYGAGSQFLEHFSRAKAWNIISWVSIAFGVAGWIVFLLWKP